MRHLTSKAPTGIAPQDETDMVLHEMCINRSLNSWEEILEN